MAKATLETLRGYWEDEKYPINLCDPKTGAVICTIENEDSLLPFEVKRPHFSVSDGYFYDNEEGEELPLLEVRKALALSAKAQRTHKTITVVGEDKYNYENDLTYTVVAGANGSLQFGCQKYTAAEVKEAAAVVRKASKS